MFPRENLYDRIILPGKLYNLDNFTSFSEEGIFFRYHVIRKVCVDFAFVTELNFVMKINEILVKISVTLLRAQIVPARIQGT